jgi:hypothetical protein
MSSQSSGTKLTYVRAVWCPKCQMSHNYICTYSALLCNPDRKSSLLQTNTGIYFWYQRVKWDHKSTAGIVACYRLDSPGIKYQFGARFSAPSQTSPKAHPASSTGSTRSWPGVRWPGHSQGSDGQGMAGGQVAREWPGVRWPGNGRGSGGQGMVLTTHHHLVPKLKKEQTYTSTNPLCLHGRLRKG